MATSPDTFHARCVAACRADPSAVVGGVATANLWEFRHVFRVAVPIILVEHDRTPIARGVQLRRTNLLPLADIVARPDGIGVAATTGMVRLWMGHRRDTFRAAHRMGARSPFDASDSLVDGQENEQKGATRRSKGQTRDVAAIGLAATSRFGSRTRRDPGVAATRRQPARATVPARLAERNCDPSGCGRPSARWAVEVDHVTWHGGRFDAQRDKSRDRNARRIGWQVDRVTDLELEGRTSTVRSMSSYELWLLRRAERQRRLTSAFS